MDEKLSRARVAETYKKLERAFYDVDHRAVDVITMPSSTDRT